MNGVWQLARSLSPFVPANAWTFGCIFLEFPFRGNERSVVASREGSCLRGNERSVVGYCAEACPSSSLLLQRWILPVAVRGKVVRNSIQRGNFHGPAAFLDVALQHLQQPSSAA